MVAYGVVISISKRFVLLLTNNLSIFPHRLWDIGQQRCVHSYAVHTDSVWALASTPTFSHVYSGGRDFSVSATFN